MYKTLHVNIVWTITAKVFKFVHRYMLYGKILTISNYQLSMIVPFISQPQGFVMDKTLHAQLSTK